MLTPKFWKKYFKTYDVLNEVVPYQQLVRSIVEEAHLQKGMIVLDAGVGTGNVAMKMKLDNVRVIGIDTAEEGLERWGQKDVSAESMVHNLEDLLPFDSNFFDVIVSNNTLYAVSRDKRDEVVKEFYRVLKPGGKIVIANIKKGFSPFAIYISHVQTELQQKGILRTIIKIIHMLPETVKMFYYNALIKKEHTLGEFDFFAEGEQQQLLREARFRVGDEVSVYARQGLLVSAIK